MILWYGTLSPAPCTVTVQVCQGNPDGKGVEPKGNPCQLDRKRAEVDAEDAPLHYPALEQDIMRERSFVYRYAAPSLLGQHQAPVLLDLGKQRVAKVVRGLKNEDSAILTGLRLYHNHVRPHLGLPDGPDPRRGGRPQEQQSHGCYLLNALIGTHKINSRATCAILLCTNNRCLV